jgi:gas vesicle protein
MQLEQERDKGKEMRKLLIKKNNQIEALEYELAESAPKEYILKLVEEHERVRKEQKNVIQELMEIINQRDKNISELHNLVNYLNAEIRELIS